MANNNERRVWATVQVAADPFNEKHIYAVQELLGSFVDGPEGPVFLEAEPPILTRVLYARMDPDGKMVNVNSGSWEGRR